MQPLVSIITVVFNSEELLEKTILSVINQNYPNIEYIIIDGGSTDKTLDIISKYDKSISRWISEKDNGLYDAMNKGLAIANGEYVWFINSGDKIYSEHTLSDIFKSVDIKADVIYGETEIIDKSDNSLGMRRHSAPKVLGWKNLSKGMLVCHQSIIVRKKIAGEYNLSYRHSADFDWLIKVLKNSETIHNSNLILSKFLEGGQTKKNLIAGLKERFRIMKIHYGFASTVLNHVFLATRLMFYYIRHRKLN